MPAGLTCGRAREAEPPQSRWPAATHPIRVVIWIDSGVEAGSPVTTSRLHLDRVFALIVPQCTLSRRASAFMLTPCVEMTL